MALSVRSRLNVVLLGMMAFAITLAALWAYWINDRRVMAEMRVMARMQMATAQAMRRYTAEHVRDALMADHQQFHAASVPAFAANTAMGYLLADYPDFAYREVALNPTNPTHRAQGWEVAAIETFGRDPSLLHLETFTGTGAEKRLLLAQPLRVQPACLACHGDPVQAPQGQLKRYGRDSGFGWKDGQVAGVQVVSVRVAPWRDKIQGAVWRTVGIGSGIMLLFFIGLYVVLRRVVIVPMQASSDSWRRLASTDALTGLPNRREFMKRLDLAMQHARVASLPLSVIVLDIDHFKRLNDTYGHGAGDATLQAFGDVLSNTSKRRDLPARLGGEEFAVLLPDSALTNAAQFAEVLRKTLSLTAFPQGLAITASLGVAQWDGQELPERLLDRADAALYEAKDAGRNCVRVAA